MTQPQTPPRPQFADTFAQVVKSDLLLWISSLNGHLPLEDYKKFLASLPQEAEFDRLLIAIGQSNDFKPDSFQYALALKDTLDWPVDGQLVDIFSRAIKEAQGRAHRANVVAWVMKTGTRFHSKPGEEIKFLDTRQDRHRRGKVVSVDRPIATGMVKTADERVAIVHGEKIINS